VSFLYKRRVQFYETDAQGFVHHSNYLRYLEEARGEFLRSLRIPYSKLRDEGYEVVLLEVCCQFKKPLFYDEEFLIELSLSHMDRFTFVFEYKITTKEEIKAFAHTKHCFLKNSKIVSIPDKVRKALNERSL